MTPKSKTHKALARAKAALAAYEAATAARDANAEDLSDAETSAYDALEKTPCATDAEFLEKLRFMIAREVNIFGSPFESRAEFVTIARIAALKAA